MNRPSVQWYRKFINPSLWRGFVDMSPTGIGCHYCYYRGGFALCDLAGVIMQQGDSPRWWLTQEALRGEMEQEMLAADACSRLEERLGGVA